MKKICVAFVFLFMSTVFAQGTVYFWPNSQIRFGVAPMGRDQSVRLTIGTKFRDFSLTEGRPRYLPGQGRYDVRNAAPGTNFTSVPAHHAYQLAVLDHSPYVLSESGLAIRLPEADDTTLTFDARAIPEGIVVGYARKGLYYVHVVLNAKHYAFLWKDAKNLEPFMNAFDAQARMIKTTSGRSTIENNLDNDVRFLTLSGTGEMATLMQSKLSDVKPSAKGKLETTVLYGNLPVLTAPKAQAPAVPAGVARLRQAKEKSKGLLDSLKSEVVGQDFALDRIARQIADAEKSASGKPKVLIAAGPSGSGKTFTAQKIAGIRFGGAMLEVNGNEFREHAGALAHQRLTGSNAGKPQDGALVETAKKHPKGFTLVINEGEKMHPDIWLILMEFLDTGKITDKDGRTVKVDNLLVIITSNRGATRMFPASSKNWTQKEVDERLKSFTQAELFGYFQSRDGLKDSFELPPEVIKRVDEVIPFGPVTKDAGVLIAKSAYRAQNEFFKNEYTVTLDVGDETLKSLALAAWEEGQDARTIIRQIKLVMGEILEGALDPLALKDSDVVKVSDRTDERGRRLFVAEANGERVELPMGKDPAQNVIVDPENRERFKNLAGNMKKVVIGQDRTIEAIARGVVNKAGKGGARPFTAFLIGVSGNGKTETGRALAAARYGDEKRFRILPMGEISDVNEFSSLFGSSAQMQGGDIEREFEKILREFPQGCVIVFDEISNMGGRDLAKKTDLFMKLYNLLEEGSFVSPRDGRRFDLNKYQLIMTGNDGEELFRGVTGDDMLMNIWEQNSDPETVRETLRQSGIPNAFLNRIDVLSLTKPLLRGEVAFVTEKLWRVQLEAFRQNFPGIEIEAAPDLIANVSRSFFTADQGGRGVRKVLDGEIGGLLMQALISADIDLNHLTGVRLRVGFRDSASWKPYIFRTTPRSAVFDVEVLKNGQSIHTESIDVSKEVPKQVLLSVKNAKLTAIHEAGHAVGNLVDLTGESMRFITIRGGKSGTLSYYGYASYKPAPGHEGGNLSHDQVVARLVRLYSGSIAQQMAGFPADAGWAEDHKMMTALANNHLTKYGLDKDYLGIRTDKDGNIAMSPEMETRLEKRRQQLFEEARAIATKVLQKNWALVRSVSAELLTKGQISGERFDEIAALVGRGETSSAKNRHEPQARTAVSCRAAFVVE